MSGAQWNDRDVVFVEIDIDKGEKVMEAAQGPDRNAAFYLTLVHSARYADDGAPVFNTVAEVRAQPFRLIQRVRHLAALATDRNRVEQIDDEGADLPLDAARG